MNKKAFTLIEILIVFAVVVFLAAIVIPNFSNKDEKNTDTLILVILDIQSGVEVEDHFEVLPDFPMNRKEKIATAKGFAIVKGYITKKEAENLVFNEWDNTIPGVTVIKYYRPTQASL